jgi:uncharacterized BrkB/YihY/UPF0761 family membrane protein
MDPAEPGPDAPRSKIARARIWSETMHRRGERLAERAQEERGRRGSVDAVFEMAERDVEVGGGIIAGALAYRLFIWLLPLALVAVAGLGIAADAGSESPESTARSLGLAGLVSNSLSSAAQGPGRWYALLVGIPLLVYATRSVLRALIGAHRLVWIDIRGARLKPTLPATLRLLVLLLCFPLVSVLASAVRAWSTAPGILVSILAAVPYAALWLLISTGLPHLEAPWRALVPGAIVVAFGVEVLQVVTAYFLAPYAITKQGTYGALGAAAALLFALFLISRLIVSAAVVNATLWERRTGRA